MQASAPAPPVPNAIPSIRLISATPSSTVISSSDGGNSTTSSASFARALEDSWDAAAAAKGPNSSLALAPKVVKAQENAVETTGGKKRLVPKKSKLGIFSSTPFGSSSSTSANTDFSDVVRRIGAPAASSASSLKAKGGFEIYVDPTDDPDIGEILVVRKRPSRVRGGLGGVGWGVEVGADAPPPMPQPMGEKTNLGGAKEGLGKVDEKEGGKERWWTIGRGRKDSKDEKKKGKENSKMSASLKRMCSFCWYFVWLLMLGFSLQLWNIYMKLNRRVQFGLKVSRLLSLFAVTTLICRSTAAPDLLASTFKLSATPTQSQAQGQDTRARFNSLDSGLLLSQPHVQANANANINTSSVRMRGASTSAVSTLMGTGSGSVSTHNNMNTGTGMGGKLAPPPTSSGLLAPPSSTSGGFLAPPPTSGASASQGQGSIALRAMRSVRSLARMGSWAQFSGAMEEDGRGSKENGTAKDKAKKKSDGTVGKKEGKEKKTKNKKTEDPESRGDDAKKSKKSSSKSSKSKSSKLKESAQTQAKEASTPRLSTSSFEVGALSASPGPMAARTLGESTSSNSSAGASSGAYLGVGGVAQKKRSILGLGLPSTIRLPTVRSGSTASSVLVGGANTVGPSFGAPTGAATNAAPAFSVNGNNNDNATNDNRLSVDSALNNAATTPRPSSVLSNASSAGSSLRPISTTSTDSRLSRASSVASSIKWDEEGLETIRERRGRERAAEDRDKDKADKRTSRESKHSSEGRKRGSLASLFPDSRRGSYASSEGGREEKGGGRVGGYPIVTIEEATVDGHGSVDDDDDRMLVDEESGHRGFGESEDGMDVDDDDDEAPAPTETPVKQQKVRTRPVSEQLLKGSRPKAVYEDDEG